MRLERTDRPTDRLRALRALQAAVRDDAALRYPYLLEAARRAGASDDEIDVAVHEAVRELFVVAEQPITTRELAQFSLGLRLEEALV